MVNEQRTRNTIHGNDDGGDEESPAMIRDIYALTTPPPSSSLSIASSSDNFTTISHEFNALVLAGSTIRTDHNQSAPGPTGLAGRLEANNPLAIVIDPAGGEAAMRRVKKEEAESKIGAWQNAKVAKINNRFKREEAIINGWEEKQAHEASSWMKRVERKIEEKRARATEKMENEIAKAQRKAEERKASAEGKRGTNIARVLELANFMRAMGTPPSSRSFF